MNGVDRRGDKRKIAVRVEEIKEIGKKRVEREGKKSKETNRET